MTFDLAYGLLPCGCPGQHVGSTLIVVILIFRKWHFQLRHFPPVLDHFPGVRGWKMIIFLLVTGGEHVISQDQPSSLRPYVCVKKSVRVTMRVAAKTEKKKRCISVCFYLQRASGLSQEFTAASIHFPGCSHTCICIEFDLVHHASVKWISYSSLTNSWY